MDWRPAKEDPMLKMGIITGFLSQTKDRFHEYNKPLELDQKFELMTRIEGYDGVEIVYPYEVGDAKLYVDGFKAGADDYFGRSFHV